MSDISSQKIEPVLVQRTSDGTMLTPAEARPAGLSARPDLDQLARIEEKTARMEEKFARSEALLVRVQATFEEAMTEFGGLARQADVAALDSRLRSVPGFGAMLVMTILGVVLGAAATVAALKFGIPFVVLPR